MEDCIFCKIIKKQIPTDFLYEDEHIVVFKDIHPKANIHLLVVPKLHLESLASLDPAHQALLGHIMTQLQDIAQRQGLKNGFRTIINTGPGGGQEVPHLHLHLLGGGRLPVF